jgi:FtsH-binding integral membrane protein
MRAHEIFVRRFALSIINYSRRRDLPKLGKIITMARVLC